MSKQDLPGFGQELADLKYQNFWDWFVKINDPRPLWEAQPTYVLSQIVIITGTVLTLMHALKNGGRLPYLWAATVIHGLIVESLSYALPDVDNFWHSQAIIIFLGRRLPLHIIGIYPVFIYNATVAAAHMKLHRWAEPFAAGLITVLIDIPYDIVSVKFIHWSWHDTDPNISDRHYWVPWTSYYFHATFAASFCFWFSVCHKTKWEVGSLVEELRSCMLAGLLGAPGGVFLFTVLYHPLHDIAKIHTEVIVFVLLTVFLVIVWTSDRSKKMSAQGIKSKGNEMLLVHLAAYYLFLLGEVIFGSPENEVSVGFHEPTGPCNETTQMQTAFGMVLQKQRYLCVTSYEEGYYDFHCLPDGKPPKDYASWYTICGTSFSNRTEYIVIISTICLLATFVFWNIYFHTWNDTRRIHEDKISKKKSN